VHFGLGRGFSHYDDVPANQHVSLREVLRASALGKRASELARLMKIDWNRGPFFQRSAREINDRALAWLNRNPQGGGRPYFMFLNYLDGHAPYSDRGGAAKEWPADLAQIKDLENQIRKRRNEEMIREGHGAVLLGHLNERMNDPADVRELSRSLANERVNAYDNGIRHMDQEIRRLVDAIARRGELDRTVFVVTSDHGDHFGEHGLFDHGDSLYRELVHVPLIIFGPRVPAGVVVREPVSTRELAATLCELAGIEVHPFPGPALMSAWSGSASAAERVVLCQSEHIGGVPGEWNFKPSLGPMWAVVTSTHTYIRTDRTHEELYDHEHDPFEAVNLAAEPSLAPQLVGPRAVIDGIARETVLNAMYRPPGAVRRE
jgi:arylsulfatase A-like enzyme